MRAARRVPVLAFILTLVSGLPAVAQDYCAQIRAEITTLQSSGNAGNYQRLLQSYNSLYGAANAQGCIRLIQRLVPPGCDGILGQLYSVQAQLDAAQREAWAQGDPAWRAQRLAQLQAAYSAQCSAPAPVARQSITLCVRTCDGYFFPIGFASDRDDYERDALLCQARCPNQEVRLFVRPSGDSPIEEARAVVGDASYTDLLNALLYREAYQPHCACAPADGRVSLANYGLGERFETRVSAIAGNDPATEETSEEEAPPPVPRPRPEPSEDPETVANRAGGLDPVRFALPDTPVAMVDAAGIRLVGPAHPYAQ